MYLFCFVLFCFGTGNWIQGCLTTEPHPQPCLYFILRQGLAKLLRTSLSCWGWSWTPQPSKLRGLQVQVTVSSSSAIFFKKAIFPSVCFGHLFQVLHDCRCMGLSLCFLFCITDLCADFYANTLQFSILYHWSMCWFLCQHLTILLLMLCSIIWSQVLLNEHW